MMVNDRGDFRPPPPEARKKNRVPVDWQASLKREGRGRYQVRVFDISFSGCKVEIVEQPRVGEPVWIKFDSLETIPGTVCWAAGAVAGVEFEREIYPAVLELLLKRQA
jgi:hypothetical protein